MKLLAYLDNLGTTQMDDYLELVNSKLAQSLAYAASPIKKPLKRLLTVKGKRLRPAIMIAIHRQLNQGDKEQLVNAASAIEIVHLASLVHDDLIDQADSRWQIPTINASEGAATAILVGDYLLAEASRLASEVGLEAVRTINGAIQELCNGQALELADHANPKRTISNYYRAVDGKSATLFAVGCMLAGTCSGLSHASTNKLADFGYHFGRAFQLIDDLLDFLSDPKLSLKPTGQDVRAGVYTLPVLMALQSDPEKYESPLTKPGSDSYDQLVSQLRNDHIFDMVTAVIESEITQAEAIISNIASLKNSQLAKLPTNYWQWAKRYQITGHF